MSLSFTMLPDALVQFHALLICFAKFSESICIEATKGGYACTARADSQAIGGIAVACQVYIKALLSVFKGRVNDTRDKDNVVERCEVRLYDGGSRDDSKCRLAIRMFCKHGVVKTYKLTYEAVDVQHAIFDSNKVENRWCIDAHVLREVIEHFGSNAEQLDIYCKNDRAVFTSFTTKVVDGNEILRQPVHTSVAIDIHDFDYVNVQPAIHAAISAKDFKALVTHAHNCKVPVVCEFSQPCKPMRLSYDLDDGSVLCEFTLMTRDASGDAAAEGAQRTTTEEGAKVDDSRIEVERSKSAKMSPQDRFLWRQQHGTRPLSPVVPFPSRHEPAPRMPEPAPTFVPGASSNMPPPLPRDHVDLLNQPQPTASLLQDESLFVPADDGDGQWDEPEYEDENEDVLRWEIDAPRIEQDAVARTSNDNDDDERASNSIKIPPTQRISQIHGLFD
ncbi:hypothetical protein KEM56_005185 [Ascosphaera pollenicola]|nr:hypothetical protein KEM56_005185 [Ascosphaera pollenicola]